MTKNTVTEWAFGEGALRFKAHLLLLDRSSKKLKTTVITAIVPEKVLSELPKETDGEMWIAEVIIIPKFKFRGHKPNWYGWQLEDQILSDWGLIDNWEDQVFGPKLPASSRCTG